MERPNPGFLYDTTPNLEFKSRESSSSTLPPLPVTPTEPERSRFDQHQSSLSSSPTHMIKITEDDYHQHGESSISDILPTSASSTNRRLSMVGSSNPTAGSPRTSIYGGNLEAGFAQMNIPGGNVPGNRNSISALKYTPQPAMPARDCTVPEIQASTRNRSPVRNLNTVNRNRSSSPRKFSPFNFKSTNLSEPAANSLTLNSNRASHRKGHRYKHSSVSMNIIPEPKIRAPLKVQASYPIPTINEFFASLKPEQRMKLLWSLFHLFTSLVTFLIGFKYGVHSFATLSHLIFYDALSCLVVVFVDIMTNFDVWNKSSIQFPFGLGRIEVLFGFGLSISLIFVGCDLFSHFMEELMASLIMTSSSTESHEQHASGHSHGATDSVNTHLNIFGYQLVLLVNILITLVSAQFIVNAKNAGTKSTSVMAASLVKNPSHFVTLVFSGYLIFQPLVLNIRSDFFINEFCTFLIACFICAMGWKVVKYLGYVVLLSFPDSTHKTSTSTISEQIKTQIIELDEFKSTCTISNLIISKVHMKLIIVLIKVRMMGGSDSEEVNLRLKIHEVLKNRYPDDNIESTIDINRI